MVVNEQIQSVLVDRHGGNAVNNFAEYAAKSLDFYSETPVYFVGAERLSRWKKRWQFNLSFQLIMSCTPQILKDYDAATLYFTDGSSVSVKYLLSCKCPVLERRLIQGLKYDLSPPYRWYAPPAPIISKTDYRLVRVLKKKSILLDVEACLAGRWEGDWDYLRRYGYCRRSFGAKVWERTPLRIPFDGYAIRPDTICPCQRKTMVHCSG